MRLPGVALLHWPRRPVLLDAARRVGEAQRAGVPPAAQVAQGEGGGGPGHQEVDGEEAEGALLRWGRRPNGFLGLSLNDRTILFLVILEDKTVSVG